MKGWCDPNFFYICIMNLRENIHVLFYLHLKQIIIGQFPTVSLIEI